MSDIVVATQKILELSSLINSKVAANEKPSNMKICYNVRYQI